ncbi:histidine kinase N-terminal 7TM domain-containing protein [Halostella litorea]|uniref:histidine kinase N-terminal 7TM domain-containing protein n=1 Tax=Halostella litorea TaxID=2528831 RepID=UPI0010921CD9|nr:histidine kinase N-terminal 7TM domain-containing protein [Halostella litorea]
MSWAAPGGSITLSASYVALLFVSGVAMVLVFLSTLRRWSERVARLLGTILVATAVWCCAYALQITSSGAATAAFWNNVRVLGPTLISPLLFLFAAEYTGRDDWRRPRRIAALFVIPALTNVLTWTNHLHHLVRRDIGQAGGLFTEVTPGPWAVVYSVYDYALIVAAIYLFVASFRRRRDERYRGQAATVLVAITVPVVTNAAYFVGVTAVDGTPFAFAVAGVMLATAVYRYRLLDLIPIARSTVFDSVEAGVLVVDTEDTIVDANERGAAIVGPDPSALVGTKLSTLVSDHVPSAEPLVDEFDTRTRLSHDCGTEQRWFDVTISPIRVDEDRGVGRLIMFTDVTDQVLRQRALERRSTELERKNERLEEVASIVSHDLRNPLNVIDGYLDLARETGDPRHFDEMEESLDRMEGIIDEMLTMAKQGRSVDDPEDVALSRVADEAWNYVDTREATLENDVRKQVRADRSQLLQIFENLYRNAIEHGGDDVTVRVGTTADGFFVEDNGPGIPTADREAVFDRGHTSADDGTGFGLSIVRMAVEAHDWRITVTEGTDGGARFEIATGEST